jgi:hypothetical protein
MANKRAIGIGLAVVLVAGIVFVVVSGKSGDTQNDAPSADGLTVVTGIIGSEKKPFFEDKSVKAVFAKAGYDVQVSTAGSRQIATSTDLTDVDFVFPSSAPAAEKIRLTTGAKTTYSPFHSSMAVATFKPIVELLAAAGIAHQDAAGTWRLDGAKYLAAVQADTRWNQLPGAAELYNSTRSIMISSTDVRQSNSAAMYLSIASYVANGNNVVASQAEQDAIADQMSALFLGQGYSAASSEAPFEDYLSQGIGSKPMVMVYEAQFLGRQMSKTGSGAIADDMLLMYPDPDVLSKHTVVPLTDGGDAVGAMLQNDPKLAKLAALYGFRPADTSVFVDTLTERGVAVPESLVGVVEPPSFEFLESMIENIGSRYTTPAPTEASDQ